MATTTSMNFTLSAKLLENYAKTKANGDPNGINVYAVAFDGNGNQLQAIELFKNGAPTGTTSLALTSAAVGAVKGGNVLVITQEENAKGALGTISSGLLHDDKDAAYTFGDLTAVGATGGNPEAYQYRYDAIEFTLSGTGSDVADLTNITQFGGTMSLTVNYSAASGMPTDSRGYSQSASWISTALGNLNSHAVAEKFPTDGSPLSGQTRETFTAGTNLTPNPINDAADWTAYVAAFKKALEDGGEFRLASYFNGVAADPTTNTLAAPASLSYFEVQYSHDMFWLVPVTLKGLGHVTQYVIGISEADLKANIDFQIGPLNIYEAVSADPVHAPSSVVGPNPSSSFTPNNAWGDIAKYFVAGFDAGFWGGSANSINPLVTGPKINLDQSWNWSSPYAYHAIMSNGGYGYENTLAAGATGYDQAAAVFFQYSNAYGYSYSDLISNGGGVNPGIAIYDPGTQSNVTSIDVELFDFNEIPTGYKETTLNYLAPSGAAVNQVPGANIANGAQFVFNVGLATTEWGTFKPVDGTPMSFRIYAPGAKGALSDGFIELNISGAYDKTNYLVEYSEHPEHPGEYWKITPQGSQNGTGTFVINNVPVVGGGGTSWYQFVIGSGGSTKTYNIYQQGEFISSSNGQIFNVTKLVMDGGAGATANTVAGAGNENQSEINLASGGAITYDPIYFVSPTPTPPPESPPSIPVQSLAAPLVGSSEDGTFFPLTGSEFRQGELAFSYTEGTDNALAPGYIAQLIVSDTVNPDWIMTPLLTQALYSGDWQTIAAEFGNGRYSTYMQQFLASDWGLDAPVAEASLPVNFTVDLETLALGPVDDGTALGFAANGSSTQGNWISFTATSSTLPNGTLILYATDGAGNLIDRSGEITTSVEEAALGRIGSVASDGGAMFFSGAQSVYLPVGHELHFAVMNRNGVIDAAPDVGITGSGPSFGIKVSDGFGTINLAAQVDNTLSEAATLAASQRLTDHAWIYLTQGSTVQVDVAWSGSYVNTLHFVEFDVNPLDPSDWRVGGVAYGNTAEFRNAVESNWEAFSTTQGNSTGSRSTTWTVQRGDGFYAPVLVSPDGMWFIDNGPTTSANADGAQHVRVFGENMFGFEDMSAARGADFDYNDTVVRLTVL